MATFNCLVVLLIRNSNDHPSGYPIRSKNDRKGAGIGLAMALAATQVLKSLLFGVSATDSLTFASVIVVLVAVALLACYLPPAAGNKGRSAGSAQV